MAELTLVCNHKRQLKPLVEGALKNELHLLEAGTRWTEQSIWKFEEKFHLSTQEFISRYENDEMKETMDYAEWIGEYRLLERLREKAETLRDIRFANWRILSAYSEDSWFMPCYSVIKNHIWKTEYIRGLHSWRDLFCGWFSASFAWVSWCWNGWRSFNVCLSIYNRIKKASFPLW